MPVATLTDTLDHALRTLGVPVTRGDPARTFLAAREQAAACSHYLTIITPSLHPYTPPGYNRQVTLDHVRKAGVPSLVVWAYAREQDRLPGWLRRRLDRENGPRLVEFTDPSDLDKVLQAACDLLALHPPDWSPAWYLSSTRRDHLHAEQYLSQILSTRRNMLNLLNACIDRHPTFAEAYAQRGQLNRNGQSKEVETAARRDDYTRAIELCPDVARYYASRATLQPDTAATLADMDRAVALQPTNARYHAVRAQVHLKRENPSAALADYSRAIELRPSQHIHRERRARVHEQLGNYRAALYDLCYLVMFGASRQRNHYLYLAAKTFEMWGQREAAVATLQTAYDTYEIHVKGLRRSFVRQVTVFFLALGEPAAALDCRTRHIERVLQRQPRRIYQSYLDRGDVHRRLGDLPAAFADYETALNEVQQRGLSARSLANVYRHRGRAHLRLRDWPAALADLDQAVALYTRPDHKTHQCRALVRARLGDIAGATADAKQVLDVRPQTFPARLLLDALG